MGKKVEQVAAYVRKDGKKVGPYHRKGDGPGHRALLNTLHKIKTDETFDENGRARDEATFRSWLSERLGDGGQE